MADLIFTHETPPAPGSMLEVAPGVFWIRMPLPLGIDHINLWALAEDDGWTLVDSGMNSDAIRGHWQTLLAGPLAGKPVKRLIVTHLHPDHVGLAGWFSENWGVPTYMTRTEYLQARMLTSGDANEVTWETERFFRAAGMSDAELAGLQALSYGNFGPSVYRPPSAFVRLQDRQELDIGGRVWRVIVGRGHSPEHACLYCPELGVLISGDQVLPRISSNVSVFATEPDDNPLKDWLQSIAKLRELLPADTHVLPAHGYPFRGLHDRLDALASEHEGKLVELAAACGAPMTAVEALPVMFLREVKGFTRLLAIGEALAHFHLLMDRAIVTAEDGADGVRRFRRAT